MEKTECLDGEIWTLKAVWRCLLCTEAQKSDFFFNNKDDFLDHFDRHCHICHFEFTCSESLKRHYSKHTVENAGVQQPLLCSLCNAQFFTKIAFEKHTDKHNIYSCIGCPGKFKNFKAFCSHANLCKPSWKKIVTTLCEFECFACMKRYRKLTALINHYNNCSDAIEFDMKQGFQNRKEVLNGMMYTQNKINTRKESDKISSTLFIKIPSDAITGDTSTSNNHGGDQDDEITILDSPEKELQPFVTMPIDAGAIAIRIPQAQIDENIKYSHLLPKLPTIETKNLPKMITKVLPQKRGPSPPPAIPVAKVAPEPRRSDLTFYSIQNDGTASQIGDFMPPPKPNNNALKRQRQDEQLPAIARLIISSVPKPAVTKNADPLKPPSSLASKMGSLKNGVGGQPPIKRIHLTYPITPEALVDYLKPGSKSSAPIKKNVTTQPQNRGKTIIEALKDFQVVSKDLSRKSVTAIPNQHNSRMEPDKPVKIVEEAPTLRIESVSSLQSNNDDDWPNEELIIDSSSSGDISSNLPPKQKEVMIISPVKVQLKTGQASSKPLAPIKKNVTSQPQKRGKTIIEALKDFQVVSKDLGLKSVTPTPNQQKSRMEPDKPVEIVEEAPTLRIESVSSIKPYNDDDNWSNEELIIDSSSSGDISSNLPPPQKEIMIISPVKVQIKTDPVLEKIAAMFEKRKDYFEKMFETGCSTENFQNGLQDNNSIKKQEVKLDNNTIKQEVKLEPTTFVPMYNYPVKEEYFCATDTELIMDNNDAIVYDVGDPYRQLLKQVKKCNVKVKHLKLKRKDKMSGRVKILPVKSYDLDLPPHGTFKTLDSQGPVDNPGKHNAFKPQLRVDHSEPQIHGWLNDDQGWIEKQIEEFQHVSMLVEDPFGDSNTSWCKMSLDQ
jgi:hypothetical protein